MSEIKIIFIETDGTEKIVENAKLGATMMDVARANGIDGILGDCGGGCACATCHVYVDPAWQAVVGNPDEIEEMTLDMAGEVQANSRLSCQLVLNSEMDGIKVTVAPLV
ncbi:2Fe-2S iron-sulfur cluster-binding protein [Zhongshania aquimaris]|uniref:2Fe-2S iron-sulfur cluster binding domain-containing protein n=1 Tax=Zhongshania aquimaris TaxID=2857107 RepID=A0ABS6VYN9_9GAMM|nr:2Fe-2S iron-sulfur cluster-binding protein [Zhongshania aquimaris]MBW2942746.1 2Fe-2S iron-sulfur cluster binding domain-containing protein [Zhongshania aquimaris]